MFRGRGVRGGMMRGRGGPHMMRGVPPMQLKSGRGGMGPRPLFPPHMAPRPPFPPRMGPPRPPMRGPMAGGPRLPPGMVMPLVDYPRPMFFMGQGPFRGRGGPGGPGGARGMPMRGRGAPFRGKSTPAKSPVAKPATAAAKLKRSKTEKERDEIDMKKPWVSPELRAEIEKKHEMHAASRDTKDPKDFEAFKEQRNKVTAMLRAAKLEYIGAHDEDDVDKILSEAVSVAKENVTTPDTECNGKPKAENGAGDAAPAEESAA